MSKQNRAIRIIGDLTLISIKHLSFFLLSVLALSLNAQKSSLEWAIQFPRGSGAATSLVTDAAGNVYTIGSFTDAKDFDPGIDEYKIYPSVGGYTSTFISKLDAAGNFVWAKSIGGTRECYGRQLVLDNDGNIYIAGKFTETVDFNPSTSVYNLTAPNNNEDGFVLKLNAAGNFVWAQKIGGTLDDNAAAIALDINKNVYVTGNFGGTVDFDAGPAVFNLTASGANDAFVLKLNDMGSMIWAKQFGGTTSDYGKAIHVDANGSVLVTGNFGNVVDFDPGAGTYNLTSAGSVDIFVVKLGGSGNLDWAKQFGGTGVEQAYSLKTDAAGNVFTAGIFSGTVDMDPGTGINNLITSTGSNDAFISKLDAAGNFIWARALASSDVQTILDIAVDTDGNVYTTGKFSGTIDLDPGSQSYTATAVRYQDIFITKLNSAGNFVWAKPIGDREFEEGKAVWVDLQFNLYVAGIFGGTIDFDNGSNEYILTAQYTDPFVLKLQPCVTVSATRQVGLCKGDSLTIGNKTYNTSGIYTEDTLIAASGCDSIAITDLYISDIDSVTIIRKGDTLLSADAGLQYVWFTCDENGIAVVGYNQYFLTETGGSYFLIQSDKGCQMRSECMDIWFTAIDELSAADIFQVTPNPNNGQFRISLKANLSHNTYVEISNSVGAKIFTTKLAEANTEVYLPNLPAGIYFVNLLAGSTVYRQKILVY